MVHKAANESFATSCSRMSQGSGWGQADRALSWIVGIAAVIIAAAVVYREVSSQRGAPGTRSDSVVYQEGWESVVPHGASVGEASAPVSLVEFIDVECPACQHFHATALAATRKKYEERLRVVYVHLPLRYHRLARPGAYAAECADKQGRFGEFIDVIYANPDSLGVLSWQGFARMAGVADSSAFADCLRSPPRARVDSGIALARALDVTGTPTVFVNGWRFGATPDAATLDRTIDDLLAGRRPRAQANRQ